MGVMPLALMTGCAVVLAWGLTAGVLRWARRAALDVPNARSLHQVPTPRGGGLAIVLTVLVLLPVWALLTGELGGKFFMPGWAATLLLAGLGLVDDLKPLPARVRLLIQLGVLGALLALYWSGARAPLVLAGGGMAVIALAWLVNLYNFMDGSDGLATTQAIVTGGCGGVMAWLQGDVLVAGWALLVAAASAGFLPWNRSPARIFMGDVGSYTLGGSFAILIALAAARGISPWPFTILLAPFLTDASLTLVRRVLAGEVWYEAHRSHAYQLLVQAGRSHRWVAQACGVNGLLIGAPLAWLATRMPALGPLLLALACSLQAALWWRITRGRAGVAR